MFPLNNKQHSFWESIVELVITISTALLIFLTFSLLQSFFLILYGFYNEDWNSSISITSIIESSAYNGDAISFAEIPAALFGIYLVWLFSKFRKLDSVTNYLQLHLPSLSTLFQWIGVMVFIIIFMEVSYNLLERNTPDFMTELYSSTSNLPLLWFAVVIAAPFFEEFLFRGYLFEGIKQTVVGNIGTILITSVSWAIIHLQYESIEIFSIFLIGIILGIAKLKSKSLYIPIAMHMLMNLTASVLMELS